MLLFTIAAVIAIFIRENDVEVYFEETETAEQEQHEASDSIELVGDEIFQNFNQDEFSEHLVKHHKQALIEGFIDTERTEIKRNWQQMKNEIAKKNNEIAQKIEQMSKDTSNAEEARRLQRIAKKLKREDPHTKKEPDSDYARVSNWFYPVIHRLRKELLHDKNYIDANNFSIDILSPENHSDYVIREEYVDSTDTSRNFFLDWKINIEKNISGFDDSYTPVKYTKLTAALSLYEAEDQPNYSPATSLSTSEAIDITDKITKLLITKNYKEATKLLKSYTSVEAEKIVNKVKSLNKFIEKNAPELIFVDADIPDEDRFWPLRVEYEAFYDDSRFDIDTSVLSYTFLLDKKDDGLIISDFRTHYFTYEALLTLEALFFSSIIILVLIWGIIMLTFQFKFKSIIRTQYPDTYKKLGKPKLTGNDNWTPYIINHDFTELGNSAIDIYGTHLSFVYAHIRTYLMMMILVISLIKIMSDLA